jgi:hypothetical protein
MEKQLELLNRRLKKVEEILELTDIIASFDWDAFTERDRAILTHLYKVERKGATTIELAKALGLNKPETSGRTIVYRRLKRIEQISKRLKGLPIIIEERKKWYLNTDDFTFNIKETEKRANSPPQPKSEVSLRWSDEI